MIVVMYISRFSREDPLDAIPIVTELLNLGVTIVSATEGEFRRGNIMDLIHIIMRLDQAHNESKNKSTAVSNAHELARSLGGQIGKVPYGFDFVPTTVRNPADGRPVVIQTLRHRKAETKHIAWMWETIKAHMDDAPTRPGRGTSRPGSLTGITATLERNKVPTRGNRTAGNRTENSAWDSVTVKRILRDPWIAGFQRDPVFKRDKDGNQTKNVEGYKIRRDSETMEPLLLECGPIIPPSEWYELQAWLDQRGRGKGNYRGEYLLSGMDILYCECGSVMVGHRTGGAGPREKSASYECKRRKPQPGQHAGSCTINCEIADDYVARRVLALLRNAEGDPETLAIIAEATRRFGMRQEAPETAGERMALVQERADAVTALTELYEDREAGGYSGPIGRRTFLDLEQRLNGRIEAAEARLVGLDMASNPGLPVTQWAPEEDVPLHPTGEGSWWHSAPLADRRDMLKLFIDRITVTKAPPGGRWVAGVADRVEITWAEPPSDDEYV
jgi:hypothetical protein